MNSGVSTAALQIALAVIMFGLGLSLTVQDFARIARQPRAVVVALGCQLLLLPVIAFGLVLLFDLPPLLAVGMMLLAASPGGTTANLFSYLFHGDVALNISLTAINSVIAVVTLPLVANVALGCFDPPDTDGSLGLQFTKVVQIFAMVLIPVAAGMLARWLWPVFAVRMDRPVRVASGVVLTVVIVGMMFAERENVGGYVADVGPITVVFCAASLTVGYYVPRACGLGARQAIASAMEVGIHNGTLAITIAVSVLGSVEMAVPAAVYSVIAFPLAAVFGWLVTRTGGGTHLEPRSSVTDARSA